ncbi:MAG: endonuclease/exonuclease/phosphatase family protein [Dehalococcoidia bacterium]
MRIIGWNIRAGGGRRVEHIAAQLQAWDGDVVALSEFRATPASAWLAEALAQGGLPYQLTTASEGAPALNSLLIASRWPLARLPFRKLPLPPHRCLPALIQAPGPSPQAPQPLMLTAVHGPLGATGLRRPFNQRVLAMIRRRPRWPGIVIGDTNTGMRGVDEESPVFDAQDDAWMEAMRLSGWPDAFRRLRGDERAYTWYSPNRGNGFRLDQAFVHRSLMPRVVDARYEWGRNGIVDARRDALSDHAALILDMSDVGQPAA